MKFPFLQDLGDTQSQIKSLLFSGLNRKEILDDTELSYGQNLDSETIPALSPRKPSKIISTINSPFDFKIINKKMCWVAGNKFYYDGAEKGEVTGGKKSIVDFNGNIIIFPDKKYYDYVDDEFGSFDAPDIDFATVHYNRIFGIKGSDVKACKVGDYTKWEEFSGTDLDSWAADVYSPGDFTGITAYQDHVIFFKKDQMWELYGYIPSQFKILQSAKVGCVDNEGIAEVGGILYFASESGIKSYSGGFPRDISEKLNFRKIESAKMIGGGLNLYVCINGNIYLYDLMKGIWLPYMSANIISFGKDEDFIYALGTSGNIIQFNSDDGSPVEWSATTKLFDDGIFNKKTLKALRFKLKMDIGSTIKISVSTDEGPFKLMKFIKNTDLYAKTRRETFVVVPMNRASVYQIKIEGTGRTLVYGEKEYAVGSEK